MVLATKLAGGTREAGMAGRWWRDSQSVSSRVGDGYCTLQYRADPVGLSKPSDYGAFGHLARTADTMDPACYCMETLGPVSTKQHGGQYGVVSSTPNHAAPQPAHPGTV